jgi:hypothetical protein
VSLTRCGASESASAAKLGKILAFCCEQILHPFANHRAAPRPLSETSPNDLRERTKTK